MKIKKGSYVKVDPNKKNDYNLLYYVDSDTFYQVIRINSLVFDKIIVDEVKLLNTKMKSHVYMDLKDIKKYFVLFENKKMVELLYF